MNRIPLIKIPLLLIAALILAGCEAIPPQPNAPLDKSLPVTELQNINAWVNLISKTNTLTAEESEAEILKIGKPKSHLNLLYYGSLKQHLNHREGWVLARDAFRSLANDTSLEPDLRAIARLLESHNQALINWHERHLNLQKELAESVRDRELLQRKIEVLTDLETVISNRKQQGSDAGISPQPKSN